MVISGAAAAIISFASLCKGANRTETRLKLFPNVARFRGFAREASSWPEVAEFIGHRLQK